MGVREAKVEKLLHDEVTKRGGTTRKWVSPGRDGVPDRIVFLNRQVYFVEVKTTSGELSIRQRREIEELSGHGADVTTVYGAEGVYDFIRRVVDTHG